MPKHILTKDQVMGISSLNELNASILALEGTPKNLQTANSYKQSRHLYFIYAIFPLPVYFCPKQTKQKKEMIFNQIDSFYLYL